MRFIGGVIEKLQRHPKRIVFPEGTEPRVLQAARQFHALRLGVPILLGDRARIAEAAEAQNISLEGIRTINPAESEDLENFARRFKMLMSLPKRPPDLAASARRICRLSASPRFPCAMSTRVREIWSCSRRKDNAS